MTAAVILISAFLGVMPLVVDEYSIEKASSSYNTSVKVLESSSNQSLGINADRNLKFGRIISGSNATKSINMTVGKKSLVTVETEGNISEVLKNKQMIYFKGQRKLDLEVKGRNPGFYSGEITLSFDIPRDKIGEIWLDTEHRFKRSYSHLIKTI